MPKNAISTDRAAPPGGDYSQGWQVEGARFVFTAGQTSVNRDGNIVGVGDIALQTRTAFENVRGILEAAGASMSDIVKMTVYVTNVADYLANAGHVRKEVFAPDFPSSSLIGVAALARPEFMVEVEAIAAVG